MGASISFHTSVHLRSWTFVEASNYFHENFSLLERKRKIICWIRRAFCVRKERKSLPLLHLGLSLVTFSLSHSISSSSRLSPSFSLYGFVFVTFSFFLFLTCGVRVTTIATWTPLSPKHSKATDRVATFPVAFGAHVGCCIEPCLWSVLLSVLDIGSFFFVLIRLSHIFAVSGYSGYLLFLLAYNVILCSECFIPLFGFLL